jgi:exopolysaccharide biosynthesis polyprenyl glycosylphosphotransferase
VSEQIADASLGAAEHVKLQPASLSAGGSVTLPLPANVASEVLRTAELHRRGWLVRRMLLVADVLGILAAFGITELIFLHHTEPIGGLDALAESLIFVAALPLWVVAIKTYGLYDQDTKRTDHTTSDELSSVFHLVTVVVWGFFGFSWLVGLIQPDQAKLACFWALCIAGISLMRVGARALARRRPAYLQNTLILGAGDVGQVIGRKLLNHPEYGLRLIGFVDAEPKERRLDLDDLTILGTPDDLADLVDTCGVERVIVAFSNERHENMLDLLRAVNDLDVQIDIIPRLFEVVSPTAAVHSIEGVPLISVPPFALSRSSRLLKRAIDIGGAAVGLVVLAPLLALIALLIKLDSRGSVLFQQIRMGSGDRPFRIFKFRTMVVDADERKAQFAELNKHVRNGDPRMFKIPDDPRVTRVGAVLRRYSLDELPQLFNVLRGQMSLVGPRPLILDEDEHVNDWARKRLQLRPGMTGLWQVMGRSEIPFEEMVTLDYIYVTGWSVGGDLKLLARTVPAIFRTRAVY